MIKIICVALFIGSFTSCSDKAADKKMQAKDSLTNELNNVYKEGQFNGFSVAVVNEKGTLYQQGIGFANIAAKEKYTDSTIQNIASISKTFIGIALLKAQEMGKLKLDDPINRYLPFKVVNPYYPDLPITIRHLVTHTSGIIDNEFYMTKDYYLKPGEDAAFGNIKYGEEQQVFNPSDSAISLQDFLKNVLLPTGKWYAKKGFLNKEPGEIYEYSNTGAALAGYIIEMATGTPLDKFTKNHILEPLQMNASGWHFEEVDIKKYSRLYLTKDTLLPYYFMITYPDGNFITSANDLAKYLTELMKGYKGNGTLLSKESYTEYFHQQLNAANFTERATNNPYDDSYNIGVFIGFSYTGNIGHTGGDPGVATMMFFDPKIMIGRLLIVNTGFEDKAGNDQFYHIWDKLEKWQYKL